MANQDHILDMTELPEGAEVVNRPPIDVSKQGAVPPDANYDRYQGAVIPKPYGGLDTDLANSQLPQLGPVYRLQVIPPSGNAQVNAAAQTQVVINPQPTPTPAPAPSGGAIKSIAYVGNEFTINSPDGPDVVITKNPQPPHTYWAAPIDGLSSLLGFTSNNYNTGSGGSPVATDPTITFTPQQFPSWIYYFQESVGNNNTAPSGWTTLLDGAILQVPSTAPVTATDPTAPGLTWCNLAVQFSGTIPSIANSAAVNFTITGTGTGQATHLFSTTAGNTLIIAVRANNGVSGVNLPIAVEDSQGNVYSAIGVAFGGANGSNGPAEAVIYASPNIPGGFVTLKASTIGVVGGAGARANFIELGPLNSGPGLPTFRPIAASDLPGLPASQITSGLLALKVGGTGADLSATGGVSQVLTQPSVGAAVSVLQLDYPDLAGQSVATKYANNFLAGKGLPSIVFQSLQTRGGNDTFTVGTLPAGIYRVSVTLVAISGTLTSDTIPECDFTFNDPALAATTVILTPTTNYLTPGTITTYTSQSVILSITASSPVSFSTTGYLGTGTYRIIMQMEQL